MITRNELAYYHKQLILAEFGPLGQKKLKESSVVVVGAGGLGSTALYYLAGTGIGNITIIDGDVIQTNNLHRQILYTTNDTGEKKAIVAARRLSELNPFIKITPIPHYITPSNMDEMTKNAELIIDATDNFETRTLLGDFSAKMQIPLIFAAIYGFEGQLTVFNYKQGPGFRHLFSEKADENTTQDCTINGVIGVVPGIMGCLQANEAIKVITGIGTVMSGKLLLINMLTLEMQEFAITHTIKKNYNNINSKTMIYDITPSELKERLKTPNDLFLLDVREPSEFAQFNIGGTLIPLNTLPEKLNSLPSDKDIVVICSRGSRSLKAAQFLSSNNNEYRIFNLKGGLYEWVKQDQD